MVTLIVIAAAVWLVGAIAAGVGVGRVISRADATAQMSGVRRHEHAGIAAR